MRSVPPQHQHEPEDFVLPRLFDSLGLTSNAKLFGEAQAIALRRVGARQGKDAANNNPYTDYPRDKNKKKKGNSKTKARGAGYNHLTIIARAGEVVAWGFNSFSAGPRPSVHSEVAALRALFSCYDKAGRTGGRGRGGAHRSEGFDLVNVRFTFDSLRISRPCRRCWLFLSKHLWRFRRVMYTTSDGLVVCMSAEEFASTPSDHVSKGHRPDYCSGGGGVARSASTSSSPRNKKKVVRGSACSHMARHAGCCS